MQAWNFTHEYWLDSFLPMSGQLIFWRSIRMMQMKRMKFICGETAQGFKLCFRNCWSKIFSLSYIKSPESYVMNLCNRFAVCLSNASHKRSWMVIFMLLWLDCAAALWEDEHFKIVHLHWTSASETHRATHDALTVIPQEETQWSDSRAADPDSNVKLHNWACCVNTCCQKKSTMQQIWSLGLRPLFYICSLTKIIIKYQDFIYIDPIKPSDKVLSKHNSIAVKKKQ